MKIFYSSKNEKIKVQDCKDICVLNIFSGKSSDISNIYQDFPDAIEFFGVNSIEIFKMLNINFSDKKIILLVIESTDDLPIKMVKEITKLTKEKLILSLVNLNNINKNIHADTNDLIEYLLSETNGVMPVSDTNNKQRKSFSNILLSLVRFFHTILHVKGYINPDFGDIQNTFQDKGYFYFGEGIAQGAYKAQLSIREAFSYPISSNLFIKGARALIYHIMTNKYISFMEIEIIGNYIRKRVNDNTTEICGLKFFETFTNKMVVNVIISGLTRMDIL